MPSALLQPLDIAPETLVGVIMGSQSDWPVLQQACLVLETLKIPHQANIVSAHRTPDRMMAYARHAADTNLKVIIAGAGGAAHLPGMVASMTHLPVLGVPVSSQDLGGLDSLYSIVQMPFGIPVGCMKIGAAGAQNAALLAASILALHDSALTQRLIDFRQMQTDAVPPTPQ